LDSLPILLGFAVAAPIGGLLSDRYGVRTLATIGVGLVGLSGLLFMTLPADFSLVVFCLAQLPAGIGLGLFAAPNTAMLMRLVPAVHRGAASGMRATVWNAGLTASQAVFFTILVSRLSITLPGAMQAGMVEAGVPAAAAAQAATLSPGSAIFAALLGTDPLSRLLPHATLAALPHSVAARLIDPHFFAQLLSQPFLDGMRATFTASIVICAVCAVATLLMEPRRPRTARATTAQREGARVVARRTAETNPD
jgi:MFS family permease